MHTEISEQMYLQCVRWEVPRRCSRRGQAAFTGRWHINYFPILLPKCLNSWAGDNDSVGKSVSNHEDLSSNFQHPLKKKARYGCECLSLQPQRADIELQRSLASQPSQNSFQFSERPCHQVIWWSVRRFYLMTSTCTHMNPPTYTSNISALHIHTLHHTQTLKRKKE